MNPLFAQTQVPAQPMLGFVWVALLVDFIALMIFVWWVVESSKRRHQRREWEHNERMRMIEMGMPVPPRESSWPKAFLCSVIGGGVPFLAFTFTYMAHERPGSADELWLVPAIISGASILATSILAGHLFRPRPASNADASHVAMKPMHDADAFDVVGSRG